ncbi:MAG: hypothetical protein ACON44_00925 [Candidatus Puniceispirillaceae bacterium]
MKQFLIPLAIAALGISSAHALTLKSGQVIGGDGNVYDGASPEQQQALINRAQNGGDIAGLTGASVFVVVGDTITYVPVDEIRGKSDEQMKTIIGDEVIQNVTGVDELTLADVENATTLAEQTGVPLEELVSVDGLDGLAPEVLDEIATVAAETGIDFENLVAVNAIISELPDDEFQALTEELATLVEEGFAEEINDTLNNLSEIEGGLDNFFNFSSEAECVAAGASNCAETAAAIQAAQQNSN